ESVFILCSRKVRVKEPQLIPFTLLFSAQRIRSDSLLLTFQDWRMRADSLLLTFPGRGMRAGSLMPAFPTQPMTTPIKRLGTLTDNENPA
ncbi:MAG: hypothetical protein QNK37_25420, partial [Acidobacteriota bacterium]|nr:hypothetical protein [Acidobacteriota bacterium]